MGKIVQDIVFQRSLPHDKMWTVISPMWTNYITASLSHTGTAQVIHAGGRLHLIYINSGIRIKAIAFKNIFTSAFKNKNR